MHHCARWGTVGYGETLLEAMISEGLAEHFDIEVNKTKPTMWATALDKKNLEKYLLILAECMYLIGTWYQKSQQTFVSLLL